MTTLVLTPGPSTDLRARARAKRWALAAGLALGYLADQLFGDPRRCHPVAGFGRLAGALERVSYADHRLAGGVHVAVLVGSAAALGLGIQRAAQRRPPLLLGMAAAATWTVLGGRSLRHEAMTIAGLLAADDPAAARVQLRNLVGRETSELTEGEIARACVESVAENTSDAVVAPLLWGAVAGLPGLLGYRALNTLDAMIGHRSPRYCCFGWAAARLDDVANWVPARVAGALAGGSARLVGGSTATAICTVRRDAGQHPSPNAGVVESAFAGALGVRLGGQNVYDGRAEERGVLGDGRPVQPEDIPRANRLATATSLGGLLVAVLIAAFRGGRR